MSKQKISNPLALAVLVLLFERPMHPYEMAALLRERNKEESIKLPYGSLYTIIGLLQRESFIVQRDTTREGRRPERTTYALTPAGRDEMHRWLRELISTPIKEYPHFQAGLALLPALPPAEVNALLHERLSHLDREIGRLRANLASYREQGIDPLVLVEVDYQFAMLQAEREWVAALPWRIEQESWGTLIDWHSRHAGMAQPESPPNANSQTGTTDDQQE